MAKRIVIGVRIAIVASAIVFGTMLWATQEILPAHGGATFVNGQAYAPGRYPGDGRSK